jgi:hypothetical protein
VFDNVVLLKYKVHVSSAQKIKKEWTLHVYKKREVGGIFIWKPVYGINKASKKRCKGKK